MPFTYQDAQRIMWKRPGALPAESVYVALFNGFRPTYNGPWGIAAAGENAATVCAEGLHAVRTFALDPYPSSWRAALIPHMMETFQVLTFAEAHRLYPRSIDMWRTLDDWKNGVQAGQAKQERQL